MNQSIIIPRPRRNIVGSESEAEYEKGFVKYILAEVRELILFLNHFAHFIIIEAYFIKIHRNFSFDIRLKIIDTYKFPKYLSSFYCGWYVSTQYTSTCFQFLKFAILKPCPF